MNSEEEFRAPTNTDVNATNISGIFREITNIATDVARCDGRIVNVEKEIASVLTSRVSQGQRLGRVEQELEKYKERTNKLVGYMVGSAVAGGGVAAALAQLLG